MSPSLTVTLTTGAGCISGKMGGHVDDRSNNNSKYYDRGGAFGCALVFGPNIRIFVSMDTVFEYSNTETMYTRFEFPFVTSFGASRVPQR